MTSRPRVLVLGGTQFIGRATVEALLATDKYEITIVTRGRTPSPFDGDASVRHVLCDRRSGGALRALLASDVRPWHAVVDFLAFEPDDVRPILELGERAGLYVVISTDSVYMACDPAGFVRDASGFGRLDEMSDELRDAARAKEDEYGRDKLALEDELHARGGAAGLRYVALRLPDVLGPHENTGRQEKLFKRLVRGAKVGTRIDGGDADAPISVVFAADVGAAIARLLEAPREAVAGAGALHICCAETPTWHDLVELAAELLHDQGIEVPPVVFDDAKENPLVSVDVGALSGAKAARLLPGWAPAPLRERLAEAVAAWVAEMRDAYDGQVRDEERRARRGDS